jgi:hypothetical protein
MVVKRIDLENVSITLDELLSELDADTKIILTRGNKTLAQVSMPVRKSKSKRDLQPRILGLHEGQGWISDDFTAELPDSFWLGEDE